METVSSIKADVVSTVDEGDGEPKQRETLRYTLTQRPPILVIIGGGLQHVLICLPTALAVAFVVSDGVCAEYDSPLRTTLFSSTLLMCGICTILVTALGLRLPIFQGPSSVFISMIAAVQKQDEWICPNSLSVNTTQTVLNQSFSNSSFTTEVTRLTQNEKLAQLSGSLMAASILEIVVGGTGLVGLFLRFVGPVTVAPTIALLGMSLYRIVIHYAVPSWELALTGTVLILVFVSYLGHLRLPCTTQKLRSCRGCKQGSGNRPTMRMFQLIPILLSVLVVWCISGILTHFNVFPNDPSNSRFRARTDIKSRLIQLSPWFHMPYPGQFGMPSFNVALFIGFIGGFFSSFVESVGDYFAAANACEVGPPPDHAVNRGIFVEGIGGLLSGAFGVGHATTSYSGNVAAMTLTKTANRTVMYCAGLIMIVLSVVGKFGAVLATVPDPALAGALAVVSGMLVSVGLASLQYVNLSSSRNLLILGMAFFVGTIIPEWLDRSPDIINTGSTEADNILKLVFGIPMILGGITAVVLDNIIKGSRKDRGLDAWKTSHGMVHINGPGQSYMSPDVQTYGWPCQLRLHRYIPWCFKLPFMPSIDVSEARDGYDQNRVPFITGTGEIV